MKTRLAITLALLATLSFGQLLQVTISPNPAPLGAPITVNANEAYGLGLFSPGNGGFLAEVRSGSPAGPTVAIFPATFLPGAIPPCGSPPRTQTWTPGASITAGHYWIGITYSIGMFGAYQSEWFQVTIDANSMPPVAAPGLAATAGSMPTLGSTYSMDITAPGHTVDTYICAMSASTNVGFPLGMGIHFALDIDPIFDLSFPNPTPGIFSNFQGNTDANGNAQGIGFTIPNIPFLSCIPLHCQALIIPFQSTLPVEATNVHNFVIQ